MTQHGRTPFCILKDENGVRLRYSGIRHQGWKGWETENKNRDNFRSATELQTAKVREKRRNDENSGFAFHAVFRRVQTCLVGFESLLVKYVMVSKSHRATYVKGTHIALGKRSYRCAK